MNYAMPTQQIYGVVRCTMLTVGILRSKGATKRGHTATIKLIQFHTQRQLDSLMLTLGSDRPNKLGFDYHRTTFITQASILPNTLIDVWINCVSFTVFHVTKPSEL